MKSKARLWDQMKCLLPRRFIRRCQAITSTKALPEIISSNPDRKGPIIIISGDRWDSPLHQRYHSLAKAWAGQGYLVIYTSTNQNDAVSTFKEIEPGLYIARALGTWIDLPEAIFYISTAYLSYLVFPLPKRFKLIYDYIDDIALHAHIPGYIDAHDRLVQNATLIAYSADKLKVHVEKSRNPAVLIPNGVDASHFKTADQIEPAEDLMPLLGKQVVGYNGTIAEWFDFELMHKIAKTYSETNFVIVGKTYGAKVDDEVANLTRRSNVHFLGVRNYSELPSYTAHYSAGLIPFILSEVTLSVSPVKLFEYFAAGVPVISTDLPECRKYSTCLASKSHDEFIANLGRALNGEFDREALLSEARRNDWRIRARGIMDALANIADQRPM
ncbi:glycosyltransferase [bacterium]|nr:glycosyltransferase [bacterium]